MERGHLPSRDTELIQIVDSALAEATRKSGEWLVCRPGCSQCCVGVFAINQLDATRLKTGLAELEKHEPARAARIRERARDSAERLSSQFPDGKFSEFVDSELADHEPCPVLDPEAGRCELYESRPMTCRVFGPPVQSEGGLGVCELCFHGASDEQIAACEMKPDPDDLESTLNEEVEHRTGLSGSTTIAHVLRPD